MDLPAGANVRTLIEMLEKAGRPPLQPGFAVSVNAEFSTVSQALQEGDVVGLLPPVSGGSPESGRRQEICFAS